MVNRRFLANECDREVAAMRLPRAILEVGWRLVDAQLAHERSGNISARCPDGQSVLITPSARDYRLLRKRDLVRVDLETGEARGRWKPSSEWRLHVAVYRARPDVNAVIHHHGTWASAVAVARKTIPVLIDEAADVGPIVTAPYRPSASQELAEVVSQELERGNNAVLLANHGALAVGRDLDEAMRRALEVERLAKIYIGAQFLGGAHQLNNAEIARSREFFAIYRGTSVDQPTSSVQTSSVRLRLTNPVGFDDVVNYGFQAGVALATLVHASILKQVTRWHIR